MNEQEKAMYDSIMSAIKSNQLTTEDVQKAITESGLNQKEIADLQAQLDTVGAELKAMKENAANSTKNTLKSILTEKQEDLKKAITNGGALKFEVNKTDVLRASVVNSTIDLRDQLIGALPYAKMSLYNLFRKANVGRGNGGKVTYIDWTTATRNAATRNEGAAFPESVAEWTEYTLAIQKIADSIPVSEEALYDIDFIESEIRRMLEVNVLLKEDEQLAIGDGNAPNLKGVYTTAATFNSAAYTGFKPSYANIFDLVKIMATQIINGKESKYIPDFVAMNSADSLEFFCTKDQSGRYVMPAFAVMTPQGEVNIAGIKVIETPKITSNTLVIGDSRLATIYENGGVEIEMGRIASQFTSGMMTLRATKREGLLIRSCDEAAFLKSTDIATDLTNISATVA